MAAPLGGQPDILIPQTDDTLEAIIRLVQEAGDWQAALGAAIGQHRGGRHEPQPADIVVDALRMGGVVAIVAGDPGEQVLVAFAGHQIAVVQRRPAEISQQRIPRAVHTHLMTTLHLNGIKHLRPLLHRDSDDRHPAPAAPGRAHIVSVAFTPPRYVVRMTHPHAEPVYRRRSPRSQDNQSGSGNLA